MTIADDAKYQFATGEIAIVDPEKNGVYIVDPGEEPRTLADLQRLSEKGSATFLDGATLKRISKNLESVRVLL